MSREDDEVLGNSNRVIDDDPRFERGVSVLDNGAMASIENDDDAFDRVDVDQNPFLDRVTDQDGASGEDQYLEASDRFERAAGLEIIRDNAGDQSLGDELIHRIELIERASVDHRGRQVSEIARLSQMSEMKDEANNEIAKYVRVNPRSAYRAVLGGQAKIANDGSQQAVQVAQWSAEDDTEATAVTVSFVPFNPAVFAGGALAPLRPYGIVYFGTRMQSQPVEVDIGLGTQFTINASEVSLQVAMENTVGLNPSLGTVAAVVLGGRLSFMPCVRTVPVTRTKYIESLAFGTNVDITIPPFAKQVMLWREPVTAAASIQFRDSNNVLIYQELFAASAYQTFPLIIPGDARSVRISDTDAAISFTAARVIFDLGI